MSFLSRLPQNGNSYARAVVKCSPFFEENLLYAKERKYFPIFCAAPDNGIGGEKAGRVRAALEEAKALGCKVENPVMVGDTKFDVLGSHECEVPCIGVTWGFAVEGEFEQCGAEYVVETMDGLLELLNS